MNKSELKAELWKLIKPIEIPKEVTEQAVQDKATKEYLALLSNLNDPKMQEQILFNQDEILLSSVAFDYLDCCYNDDTNVTLPIQAYFCALETNLSDTANPEDVSLSEAEHDVLRFLFCTGPEHISQETLKKFFTVIFLFLDHVKDLERLECILSYYIIYNSKP